MISHDLTAICTFVCSVLLFVVLFGFFFFFFFLRGEISIKPGRFPAPTGRPGKVAQNRETSGETRRVNMSAFVDSSQM